MYITQTDIANFRVDEGRTLTDSDMLKDLIKKDEQSPAKLRMKEGEEYYIGKHKILNHKFNVSTHNGKEITDDDKANNHLVHTYHKLLLDQKTGYIVKNPATITTDPESALDEVEELLGEQRHDKLNDWVTGSGKKGVEFMHPYIDVKGNFKYTIISAREIIPIYDTNYEAEIVEVIRYYNFDSIEKDEINKKLETKTRKKVEWWTATDVTFYVENDSGFVLDKDEMKDGEENPRGHWKLKRTNKTTVQDYWGKVPFIDLPNNSERTTDLEPIKSLIDDYDFNASDASNNLADLQEAIWTLFGYDDEDLGKFRMNLKVYKAMALSEGGKVESHALDIPIAARDSSLERLMNDIYTFGMGVNMSSKTFGKSPSGIALKFLFSLLEIKAKKLERKLQKSLQDLIWFVLEFLQKPDVKVKFTFDYSMLVNEAEIIDSLSKSDIPPEDYYAKHPYVQDFDRAIEWKKKQVEEFIPLDGNE